MIINPRASNIITNFINYDADASNQKLIGTLQEQQALTSHEKEIRKQLKRHVYLGFDELLSQFTKLFNKIIKILGDGNQRQIGQKEIDDNNDKKIHRKQQEHEIMGLQVKK
ncbi:hypothetical protein pb186bvf_020238 [Paramecium bursaria]